ncbi:HSGNPxU motif (seleno)protein TsoX [Desulfatitalea alkaliphila]|uniref:HSGNPxU motif (seleno)protein TsoX n=1 Tax=Desulfatitalea alkaliphila TaxID=2929485 RepID=UPI003CCF8B7D
MSPCQLLHIHQFFKTLPKDRGVANDMKGKIGDQLDVKNRTLDSEEAKPCTLEFKGSTDVLFKKEWAPLNATLDKNGMAAFPGQSF